MLDGASGPRLSALALAVLIRQQAGIEVVLQFSSRDKPLLTIQSELLGAYAMGVRNLLAVTGDVRPMGDYPDATPWSMSTPSVSSTRSRD